MPRDFDKAIEINPRDFQCLLQSGKYLCAGQRQYDIAISDYNKAIEINPRYADAYNNRGNTYARSGRL